MISDARHLFFLWESERWMISATRFFSASGPQECSETVLGDLSWQQPAISCEKERGRRTVMRSQ